MPDLRYWDAVTFLGWFNEEPDKVKLCSGIVDLAENGQVKIVTSAITLTEVIKLKGRPRLTKEKEDIIKRFFEQPYISIRNVDRLIAELARSLIWQYPSLNPKDSIHVATAMKYKILVLDTFDEDLIKLDGQLGSPPLKIGHPPFMPVQESLGFKKTEKDEI